MGKTYLATRLEREDFKLVEKLAQETNLGKSEIARRLLERSMGGPSPAMPEKNKCKFCKFATICGEGSLSCSI